MPRPFGVSSRFRNGLGEFAVLGGMAAAIAVYYFSDGIALALAGTLLFLCFAWLRLDYALFAALCAAPFYRFPRQFGSLSFSVGEFLILATLLVWAGKRALPWQTTRTALGEWLRPFYQHKSALLFVGAASLSLFFTDPDFVKYSLREYRVVIVEPWLFFVMLSSTFAGRRDANRLVAVFVLLGTTMAIFSLYHYYFVGIVEATGGVRRILAIYHSPNALALFFGRVLPVALVMALFCLPKHTSKLSRTAYGLSAVLMAACIFLTYSKGAWLGVAVALLLVAAVNGRRMFILMVAAVGALGLLAVPFVNAGRLVSEATALLRLNIWQSAVNMIRDRPIFGVGMDNFLYYYRDRHYMLPEAWREPNLSHPHNFVLDYWTRLGLLGLVSLMALQWTFWRAAALVYRQNDDQQARTIALALMASMVDFLVHGFIDNSFFLIDLAVVFWFTLGTMETLRREEK